MRWLYYVVENAWVVRVSDDWVEMGILQADGTWLPDSDIGWVQKDGRRIKSEAEAMQEAREIFDLRGVPHSLGSTAKGP
ncbi:MAG: hypothetical protein HY322_01355 [Betaproteobacteria bacterium]|nr:hypothetical protein [Betaproteobacteria bacterium]